MFWNESARELKGLKFECRRDLVCQPVNKTSESWALYWCTQISSQPSCRNASRTTNCCLTGRQKCLICSLRGPSSFIVRHREQTISCVLSDLTLSEDSLKDTMKDCGGASAGCWALISRTSTPMKLPRCLFPWGLGFAERDRDSSGCLSMIKARHTPVAERILVASQSCQGPESTTSAAVAAHQLAGVEGFEVPSWESLSEGARLEFRPCQVESDMGASMKQRLGWNVTIWNTD